jgi:hypothetical protein
MKQDTFLVMAFLEHHSQMQKISKMVLRAARSGSCKF